MALPSRRSCSPGLPSLFHEEPGTVCPDAGKTAVKLGLPVCVEGWVQGPQNISAEPFHRSLPLVHVHKARSYLGALYGLFPQTHTFSVNSPPSSLCSDLTFLMRLLPCIKLDWLFITLGHTTPATAGVKHHRCMRLMDQRFGRAHRRWFVLFFHLCWHLRPKRPETGII